MTIELKHNDRKESRTANKRLAKKRVQWLIEALCFVSSAGRQFSASKSASSPSAKPLCVTIKRRPNERVFRI